MLAIEISGPSMVLYAKSFVGSFDFSKYSKVLVKTSSQVHYLDILVASKKIGELSLKLFANEDFNELYLEHCLDCVINSIYEQMGQYLTEQNVVEQFVEFSTAVSETLDDGYLLSNSTVRVFDEAKKDAGLFGGIMGGAKLIAKTLLS